MSVIVPTRDRPELLEEALQSLAAQLFTHWDAVVVDDGSSPPVNAFDLVARFGSRISLHRHERSLGGAAAKNTGIEASQAPIVAFLDDDDCYEPGYLSRAAGLLERHSDLDGVFMNVAWFADSEASFGEEHRRAMARVLRTAEGAEREPGVVVFGARLFHALLQTVPMAFQRPVARRSAFESVGVYRPDCLMWDCDWAIRACARLRFALVLDTLYLQRVHRDRTSSRAERKLDHLHSGIEIKERLFRFGARFGLDRAQRGAVRRSAADDWFSLAYFHCDECRTTSKALAAWIRSALLRPSLRRMTFPGRLLYARIAGVPDRMPSWVIRGLANLIDVGEREHANLRKALATPSIVPVLSCAIGMRLRRWIKERALDTDATTGLTRAETADMARQASSSPASLREAGADLGSSLSGDAAHFPPIIFQTWKSKVQMPDPFARWSETFRRVNPTYRHVLWDDAENRHFIAECYPWFLPTYDRYPAEIYRADAVRYFFLYQFGGLYADMDTACLRRLDPLFVSADVWLGSMGTNPTFPHSIPNAIMASKPRQQFWLLVIAMLLERGQSMDSTPDGPETMTGPILLKCAYDAYKSGSSSVRERIDCIATKLPSNLQASPRACNVVLLETEAWYPIDWSNVVHLRFAREALGCNLNLHLMRWLFPGSFLVTFWAHSWQVEVPRDDPRHA